MDPLCGWCYGNSENTLKLFNKYKDKIEFEIVPAGMWTGGNKMKQTKAMTNYILSHDAQIAERTGIVFGEDYFDIVKNKELDIDSEVPCRAIVAARSINPAIAFPFAVEVQKARYFYGQDLNPDATYMPVCEKSGIDSTSFFQAFHSDKIKNDTQQSFQQAAQYANSYPTMLIEKDNKVTILEQGYTLLSELENKVDEFLK
jgi:putative protein-disulfide isomerase